MSRGWRGSLCRCWAEQDCAGPLPSGPSFQPWEIWCLLKQHSVSASSIPTHHAAKLGQGQGQGKGSAPAPITPQPSAQGAGDLSDGGPVQALG